MSVADNYCDGHSAEIRIIADQFSYSNQTEYKWYGPWHVNNLGCNKGYITSNGAFSGNDPLMGFWVEVCDSGVTCVTSSEMYNPY
jgi:hypothetical protein